MGRLESKITNGQAEEVICEKKDEKQENERAYKKAKASVQREERRPYWSYIENMIEVSEDDREVDPEQKRMFKYVKSLKKDNTGISQLKENGHPGKAFYDVIFE